jgi:hypothetical protein
LPLDNPIARNPSKKNKKMVDDLIRGKKMIRHPLSPL